MAEKAKRFRGWQFTVNNWQPQDCEALRALLPRCSRLIWQPEIAASGTPHLQGYLELKSAATATAVMRLVPRHGHIEPCRNPAALWDYCMKGETRDAANGDHAFVHGSRPMSASDKGDAERERWSKALEAAVKYDYDAVPDDILVRHASGLLRAAALRRKRPRSRESLDNEWRWGLPGVGKSKAVLDEFGEENIYRKGPGKWWCDYRDEQVVLFDDVDMQLGGISVQEWKAWTDHAPFRGEPKGGSAMIRPAKIIVTSNHSMDEVFAKYTPVDRAALKRRFKEVYVGPAAPPAAADPMQDEIVVG